ncbi:uncharacterized protein LOC125502135 [Athalia rosae]|uniref:uncharacterized protein LOC125502135 n=1 Tax=Athalia rosae TaxID=37344 RepID=UPI002033B124|nr:uncharacterized protein LOC125502135 [Athalia rosae]
MSDDGGVESEVGRKESVQNLENFLKLDTARKIEPLPRFHGMFITYSRGYSNGREGRSQGTKGATIVTKTSINMKNRHLLCSANSSADEEKKRGFSTTSPSQTPWELSSYRARI